MPDDPDWAARELQGVVEDLMGRLAQGPLLLEERSRRIKARLESLERRALSRMLARAKP